MRTVRLSDGTIKAVSTALVGTVEFLLIILLAVLFSRLFWAVAVPGHPSIEVARTPSNIYQASGTGLSVDRTVLSRFDAFYRDIDFASGETVEDAPETTLNLTIESLLSSTDSSLRSVRIRMPSDNRVIAFREGESVIDEVSVDRILGDRIILINRGEQQTLLLRETPLSALTQVEIGDGEVPTVEQTPSVLGLGVSARRRGTDTSIDQSSIETFQIGSVMEFYRAVEIEPVFDDGEITNYRISGGDVSVLPTIGIAVGDIVFEVNGQSLADVEQEDLLARIGRSEKIRLTLFRNNERRTVEIVVGDT